MVHWYVFKHTASPRMMHPIVTKIRSILDKETIPYRYIEHRAGVTSKEMAAIRKDFSLSEGAKALILTTDTGFIQAVLPGDKKFNNSKLRKIVGTKEIRFATSQELSTVTEGIQPGAVPPFGNLFNIPVYADKSIFLNERIVFNCGERTASISMSPNDYKNLVQPIIVDIAE